MNRAAIAAIVLGASLVACDRATWPTAEPAASATIWAASGRCGVSRSCASGAVNADLTSCPESAVTYCRPGAACNPNDTQPCVIEAADQSTNARCEDGAMNSLTAFEVYACSPAGALERVN